jgi:hypothetical protein
MAAGNARKEKHYRRNDRLKHIAELYQERAHQGGSRGH